MPPMLTKLENAPGQATDAQVEQLAHDRYSNATQVTRTEGIYLKVMVAACQGLLGDVKRGRGRPARGPGIQAQLAVLEKVHTRFYAAVLRGVVTPDIQPDETLAQDERQRRTLARNARSGFARSTKSTLASYVKAGGDLRGLDVAAITKAALRAFVTPPPAGDKLEQRIARTEGALVRAMKRMAKDNPDGARDAVMRTIESLEALMLPAATRVPASSQQRAPRAAREPRHTRTRTRVGIPQVMNG